MHKKIKRLAKILRMLHELQEKHNRKYRHVDVMWPEFYANYLLAHGLRFKKVKR